MRSLNTRKLDDECSKIASLESKLKESRNPVRKFWLKCRLSRHKKSYDILAEPLIGEAKKAIEHRPESPLYKAARENAERLSNEYYAKTGERIPLERLMPPPEVLKRLEALSHIPVITLSYIRDKRREETVLEKAKKPVDAACIIAGVSAAIVGGTVGFLFGGAIGAAAGAVIGAGLIVWMKKADGSAK